MISYTEFVLILFAHVGPWGNYNSSALFAVPGFVSRSECEASIPLIKHLARMPEEINAICIERSKNNERP